MGTFFASILKMATDALPEVKLFEKWSFDDVVVSDISLEDYLALKQKFCFYTTCRTPPAATTPSASASRSARSSSASPSRSCARVATPARSSWPPALSSTRLRSSTSSRPEPNSGPCRCCDQQWPARRFDSHWSWWLGPPSGRRCVADPPCQPGALPAHHWRAQLGVPQHKDDCRVPRR